MERPIDCEACSLSTGQLAEHNQTSACQNHSAEIWYAVQAERLMKDIDDAADTMTRQFPVKAATIAQSSDQAAVSVKKSIRLQYQQDHTGKRLYACPVCDEHFSMKWMRDQHRCGSRRQASISVSSMRHALCAQVRSHGAHSKG